MLSSTKPLFTINLEPWQEIAVHNGYAHFTFFGGVGCGKTYTGAQYAIGKFVSHPDKTGFIGANNYDQLSQATLKELFYWLDAYGLEYVIDRKPPAHWGC